MSMGRHLGRGFYFFPGLSQTILFLDPLPMNPPAPATTIVRSLIPEPLAGVPSFFYVPSLTL